VKKRLVLGAVSGTAWGVLAIAVFAGMVRGVLPAPGETAIPVAFGLVLAYLPFLVGIGLETLVGRGSAPFAEVAAVTIGTGLGIGAAAAWLTSLASRGRK
jgi:hypothetical protein